MALTLLYVLAYVLGSVPFGYLVAKSRGIDITKVGSGNTGATNVYRTLGRGPATVVFLLDVAKGFVPVFIAQQVMPKSDWAGYHLHTVLIGVTAVLGHSFSPFLKFKGGKGVATGLGVLTALAPVVAVLGLGTFVLVLALSKIVSLSSICACVAVIVGLFATGQARPVTVVFGCVALFVVLRHIPNMKRMLRGEEPKIKGPKPPEEAGQSIAEDLERSREEHA